MALSQFFDNVALFTAAAKTADLAETKELIDLRIFLEELADRRTAHGGDARFRERFS